MDKENNKILPLESLRGVAAIAVALYHFKINSYFDVTFIKNSWLMVDLFFVLSGFVIALNYQGRIHSIKSVCNFQIQRFLRLYPLHFIMLFVFLGIEILKYLFEVYFNLISNSGSFEKNNITSFFANIFLLHNFIVEERTWNYPSWSVSAEFYTYLLFSVVVLFFKKAKFILAFSFLIVIFSCIYLNMNEMVTAPMVGPVRCIFSFFIGLICCNIFNHYRNSIKFKSSFPAAVFLLLCSMLMSMITINTYTKGAALVPILFAATVLVLAFTSKHSYLSKILSNEKLVYLGTISYGIYMIHAAVWYVINQLLRFVVAVPTKITGEGTVIFIESRLASSLIIILGMMLIILLAHLSYKYIETRFNSYRKEFVI